MDKLFMFAGADDARAYSVDETGSNLPEEHAP